MCFILTHIRCSLIISCTVSLLSLVFIYILCVQKKKSRLLQKYCWIQIMPIMFLKHAFSVYPQIKHSRLTHHTEHQHSQLIIIIIVNCLMLLYFTMSYAPHSYLKHESSDNLASFIGIDVSSPELTRKEFETQEWRKRIFHCFDLIVVNIYRFTFMHCMTHSLKQSLCSVSSFLTQWYHCSLPSCDTWWFLFWNNMYCERCYTNKCENVNYSY